MKNIYRLLVVLFVTGLLVISSCNKEEPIPTYIHVDGFTLVQNPLGFAGNSDNVAQDEGTLSHKISDVWFYVDDQLVGCFELPCTFPVLAGDGTHKVKMRAGIKVNGIAATRAPYPFYKIYEQDVNFQSGTKITLSPTTMYVDYANFVFMEDFEETGMKIDTTPATEAKLVKTSAAGQVFEGNFSGYMDLDDGETIFECISSDYYALPKSGSSIFLEFNYKTDHIFTVSTIAISPFAAEAVLNLNKNDNWNKAYLFLTPNVTPGSAINYYITMFMNAPGADSVAFLIDNIKIVY